MSNKSVDFLIEELRKRTNELKEQEVSYTKLNHENHKLRVEINQREIERAELKNDLENYEMSNRKSNEEKERLVKNADAAANEIIQLRGQIKTLGKKNSIWLCRVQELQRELNLTRGALKTATEDDTEFLDSAHASYHDDTHTLIDEVGNIPFLFGGTHVMASKEVADAMKAESEAVTSIMDKKILEATEGWEIDHTKLKRTPRLVENFDESLLDEAESYSPDIITCKCGHDYLSHPVDVLATYFTMDDEHENPYYRGKIILELHIDVTGLHLSSSHKVMVDGLNVIGEPETNSTAKILYPVDND